MLLLDAGTTYSKTYDTITDTYDIFPTKELGGKPEFTLGTGHFSKSIARNMVNELVALATGALEVVEENNFYILDIGSRDIKYVQIKDRKYHTSDWNMSCGAFTGFTIEMLGNYFNLDYHKIDESETEMSVTCGVFGMSTIFDKIAFGETIDNTIASFVKGITTSAHRFAGKPEKVYLSGGLCENRLFINSFPSDIIPLGRFVIIEGLKQYNKKHNFL